MIDVHGNVPDPSEEVLALFRDKMDAFIFPNIPRADYEIEAYNKAVRYQYEHEASRQKELNDAGIPDGVTSFRIGDFSMSFEDGANSPFLNMRTICPSAYGVLLRAGLLYKGVERGP